MEFTLHTENLRVTGDIEEFVQKKLSKLGRYLPNINSVHVELEQQNSTRGPDVIIAQITLRHSRGAILRTEERVEKSIITASKQPSQMPATKCIAALAVSRENAVSSGRKTVTS
jgi:putative sigma-54 modulation protein